MAVASTTIPMWPDVDPLEKPNGKVEKIYITSAEAAALKATISEYAATKAELQSEMDELAKRAVVAELKAQAALAWEARYRSLESAYRAEHAALEERYAKLNEVIKSHMEAEAAAASAITKIGEARGQVASIWFVLAEVKAGTLSLDDPRVQEVLNGNHGTRLIQTLRKIATWDKGTDPSVAEIFIQMAQEAIKL